MGAVAMITGHRKKLTAAHMELMRIPVRFWRSRLSEVPEGKARKVIVNYLQELDSTLDTGEGLMLWGPNGTGKTSVAVIITMEARRRGASALFATAETLRSSVMERTPFSEDKTLMERAREVDFLVIDDLGKEHTGKSDFSETLFENLIRERSAARKVTLVTTNLLIYETVTDDGRVVEGLNSQYRASMIEVMKETLFPVALKGHNHRDAARDDLAVRLTG